MPAEQNPNEADLDHRLAAPCKNFYPGSRRAKLRNAFKCLQRVSDVTLGKPHQQVVGNQQRHIVGQNTSIENKFKHALHTCTLSRELNWDVSL